MFLECQNSRRRLLLFGCLLFGKGILFFKTNFYDNENIFDTSDIEEKTTFTTTIKYYKIDYPDNIITCRLWKPLNERIWIFCKQKKDFRKENDKMSIKNTTFAMINRISKRAKMAKINEEYNRQINELKKYLKL